MNCYFCNNKLEAGGDSRLKWASCNYCTSTYQLKDVYTTTDENEEIIYAHIYPYEQEYIGYLGKSPLTAITIPINRAYHIRLNIRLNTTDIRELGSYSNIMPSLPGFPINPSNAKEKLKLYLLFS